MKFVGHGGVGWREGGMFFFFFGGTFFADNHDTHLIWSVMT